MPNRTEEAIPREWRKPQPFDWVQALGPDWETAKGCTGSACGNPGLTPYGPYMSAWFRCDEAVVGLIHYPLCKTVEVAMNANDISLNGEATTPEKALEVVVAFLALYAAERRSGWSPKEGEERDGR